MNVWTRAGLRAGILVWVVWGLAGCAGAPRPDVGRTGEAKPPAALAAVKRMPQPVEQQAAGVAPADESAGTVAVEVVVTEGSGLVVVNRQPIGLAPQRVALPVTEQGYLRAPVAMAVRFVAREVGESSLSVEEVLEVTDRPPARMEFSRDGVRRVFAREEQGEK